MKGQTGPNSPFYGSCINPLDGSIESLSGTNYTMYKEEHEWDLNFGTEKCHDFLYYELGYMDDTHVFHPFTDVEYIVDSTIKFHSSTFMTNFFNQLYDETSSKTIINWITENDEKKIFSFSVNVKDPGFEKVYTGNCYKYNRL